jgi:hypothetical protein
MAKKKKMEILPEDLLKSSWDFKKNRKNLKNRTLILSLVFKPMAIK